MAYATIADLRALGVRPDALNGLTEADKTASIDAASAEADSYLRMRFALPLGDPLPEELVARVVDIATYRLLRRRGFNPDNPSDSLVVKGYDDAIAWLKMVAKGEVALEVVEEGTEVSSATIAPEVFGSDVRGW